MDQLESIQRFDRYLRRRFPNRRTPVDYVCDVRQFVAVCPKPWREVTMHDIDASVDQQKIEHSPATLKRRMAALKTFFDFLAKDSGDLSWPNPVRFKRHAGKQPRRLPRDLSDQTVERLATVITAPHDRAWFALMLRAGLRVGEVVSLKRADVLSPARSDQPARLRVCGKGRKERIVLLTADAYAVLNAWVQARPASDQPALFLNGQGQPLTTSGIEWLLHRYGAQIGVALTPHQLRHTFAAKSPKGGMPITSLGKLLGHADISTTQIYTAGADPELVHAYQTAMQQLARAPLPLVETPPPARPDEVARPLEPALPAAPPPVAPAMQPKAPPLPRWEDWRPDLPATLCQASLAFVQRRLPTWRPHRRREKAMHGLAEFSHFWDWQLAQRPIAQLAKLQLTDLRTYQIFRSAEGKAASTVNDTLDYVLALLRDHA